MHKCVSDYFLVAGREYGIISPHRRNRVFRAGSGIDKMLRRERCKKVTQLPCATIGLHQLKKQTSQYLLEGTLQNVM